MLNYNNWLLMDVNGIYKPTYGHYTDGRSLEDPSHKGIYTWKKHRTKWEIFQQTIFDDQTLQEAMLLNPQI